MLYIYVLYTSYFYFLFLLQELIISACSHRRMRLEVCLSCIFRGPGNHGCHAGGFSHSWASELQEINALYA